MSDWRLFFVIKSLEIDIKYDCDGKLQRKLGQLYNKALEIILQVIDANPDLQEKFEQTTNTYDDYDYSHQEDFSQENDDYDDKHDDNTTLDDNTSAFVVLGINKTASRQEIKQKFKELILQYHPDRNKSANATIKTRSEEHTSELQSH